jgi:peptide/nickel transport system substrate-binding protein
MARYSDPAPGEGRYGGMAVVGVVAEMGGMNVFTAGDAGSVQNQMFANLMTLIQYDAGLEPVPYLAQSWEVESVADTLLQLTFHLRDDVYWHDGVLTTAQDVAFTYLTATDPRSGFPNPSFFQYYVPGQGGVEVIDSLTVRFRLRPHSEFMDPWRTVAIMPRHLLGDVPPEELARHPFGTLCPVGNGPFRFVSHSPNDRWVFEANPAFPEGLGGRPYLDRYVYRVVPEQATLLTELLTGGVDVYVAMPPGQAVRARQEPGLRVVTFPYRGVLFAAWNTRIPKLADVHVRRALTMASNRRLIMEGIQGGDPVVINSGVPLFHFAFDPSLGDSLPFDPVGAASLLEEEGWSDRDGDGVRENAAGEPLSLELLYHRNQERQEVAEILQAQLRAIGVEIRPRVLEFPAYMQAITSPERAFEGALISWETEFRLDERDLFHSTAASGPSGFSGVADPTLDRYLDTLPLITERAEALPLWREYQLRILLLQPHTYLYSAYRRDGVSQALQGVGMDARGEWATLRHWWIDREAGRDR